MATKPTDRILDWASGGSTTDPGAGKEATGWVADDRPPANWWNWILNSFGQWLAYFEEVTDEQPVKAYGTINVVGGTASVGSGSVNILSAIESTGQVEVVIDVPFSALWVALAMDTESTGSVDGRMIRTGTTGTSNGAGPASTRSMVVYLYDDAGTIIDPTSVDVDFQVVAIGVV